MKLYSVNYRGPLSNNEWSIVTIHKTLESAEAAKHKYTENYHNSDVYDSEYIIYIIDTDVDDDVVYDYEDLNIEND